MRLLLRGVLTGALLYQVWKHAHWSVALCLTLSVVAIEVIVHLLGEHLKAIDDLGRQK